MKPQHKQTRAPVSWYHGTFELDQIKIGGTEQRKYEMPCRLMKRDIGVQMVFVIVIVIVIVMVLVLVLVLVQH